MQCAPLTLVGVDFLIISRVLRVLKGGSVEMKSEVVLVSAYGRGNWLAASLAQESIETTLIDISHLMGAWPPEDVEGPFGFFKSEKITEFQMERLSHDDPYHEVSCGWTLWTSQGPIEFKGSTSRYMLDKLPLNPDLKTLVLSAQGQGRKVYQDLDAYDFSESWLLHLAHQWCSTEMLSNERGALQGQASVLTSSFLTRQATRSGHDKSLEWLKSRGVKVIRPQRLEDIFVENGQISALEIQAERKGVFKFEQLVWLLSSEETYFINEKLGKKFFSRGAVESEWSWVRYRIGIEEYSERNNLPAHCVMIKDLDMMWTHENYIILMRTSSANQFDCWIRIPTVQRFNKEYLTEKGNRVLGVLKGCLGQEEGVQVLSYPQEYSYTYAQLGPSRFPVFKYNSKTINSKFRNMHLVGVETFDRYQWDRIFAGQEEVRIRLLEWWNKKKMIEAKKKKELET